MRLNEKTYPSYMTLESGNYASVKIDELFSSMLDIPLKFHDFIHSMNFTFFRVSQKYYLTNTFKDAILTAAPKIKNLHFDYDKSEAGIFFTDKGFTIYSTNPNKENKLVCYGFTRDVLTTYGYIDKDLNFGGIASSIKDGKPYNDIESLNGYLNSTLLATYFIHNCEVETKLLKPKEKYRNNGLKYYNESKSDVTILDCKWFTDLIREAPFRVKGHLRWQVHGEKKQKRKLIWIDEFEKSGYVRKATKNLA